MTQPRDIRTDHGFMGSVFRNSECETILRNIVLLQKSVNPENWTPFTWEQYKEFCTHNVGNSEKGVLMAFVNGGAPVTFTSARLQPGWLAFDGTYFSFTEKMIQMLAENYSYSALEK